MQRQPREDPNPEKIWKNSYKPILLTASKLLVFSLNFWNPWHGSDHIFNININVPRYLKNYTHTRGHLIESNLDFQTREWREDHRAQIDNQSYLWSRYPCQLENDLCSHDGDILHVLKCSWNKCNFCTVADGLSHYCSTGAEYWGGRTLIWRLSGTPRHPPGSWRVLTWSNKDSNAGQLPLLASITIPQRGTTAGEKLTWNVIVSGEDYPEHMVHPPLSPIL